MKRLAIIVCLLAGWVLLPVVAARAQGPVEFDSMEIDVWPEYDREEALVIYKITIAAQATMPAQISLRIPGNAVNPPTVAMKDVDNQLYTLNFTTAKDGDWTRVNFMAPSPNLQLEYYDPGLTKNGENRNFEFRWPGDFAVRNMVFVVQQPLHATQMTILPTQGNKSIGSTDNLTYYANSAGSVPAGTTFTYKISYTNPDGLTAPSGSVQPPNPIATATTPIGGSSTTVLLAILGVVLIGGGLAWFFLQRRPRQPEPSVRRHTPARSTNTSSKTEPRFEGTIYCHQCGKRAAPGDVYCRVCGSRLHP